jgi:hypothetical protein
MAYNPFDEVIENDPAYKMQIGGSVMTQPNAPGGFRVRDALVKQGGPVIQQIKEKVPDFANMQAEYADKAGQNLSQLILPFYNFMALGTEKYNQQKQLNKEVLENTVVGMGPGLQNVKPDSLEAIRLISKNAPEFMDYLKNEGYESNTNILKELQNLMFVPQQQVFSKLASGEKKYSELSADEKFLTDPLLVGLDLFDVGGLTTLAARGFSKPFIKFITDAKRNNVPTTKIVEDVSRLFPDETPKATTFFLGEQKGVNFAPLRQDGPGGPSSLYRQAPDPKNNIQYGNWKRETTQTYLDELRKQAGDPNKKFDKSVVVKDLKNLFESLGVPKETLAKKGYFDGAFTLRKKDGTRVTLFEEYFFGQKQAGGATPSYFKEFSDNNPDLPGTPTYKYLTSMVRKFEQENGFKPTSVEIAKYIQRTGDDEAKSFFAIKDTASAKKKGEAGQVNAVIDQNRKQGTEGVDNLLQPSKSKEIARFIESKSKSDPFFKSQYDIAIANLNKTDSKLNTIKAQYNILVDQFKDSLGNPPFSYTQFTKYLRENNLIPKRLLSLEQVSYSPQIGASKDVTNAKETVSSMLISTDDSLDYKKYAIGLGIDDDMFRFLQHKYRSLVEDTDKKTLLPADKFIEQYVMPYKGATKKETIRNLENAYPEFKTTWQPMEDTFKVYEDYLNVKMEELAASGKYTDQQLNEIRKSLAPNRSHNFEVKRANLQDRMIGASAAGQFIEIQPFYINNSLQPIYDNLLRRIFDDLETAPNINTLKDKKIKNIELSKNKQDYSGVNTSVSKYKELFPDKSKHNQYDYLNYLYKQANEQMKDKGIVSYQVFNPKNKNIIEGYEVKKGELGDFLVVGSDGTYTPQQYIDRALKQLEVGGLPGKFNPQNPKSALRFKKRGGVQMSIGGQNFTENMNQQQFTPDPGIEGMSAFQQAVQSGNLQALNIPKIFKGLGEAFGVFTPKKVGKSLTGEMSAVTPISKSDFPLQSFTLEKLSNSKTNQAKPQDWINELQGGANKAPTSEIVDSGIFQYLTDYEKYFPNQKISKAKLLEVFENNPISNLKVRIKGAETGDPAYDSYMGRPRHENVGSARLDKAAEDYREVIIEAGTLPGQKTGEEFVNSTHFTEKNVLAFGRVGTYTNSKGEKVAVIQEMQTDYLTQVRKEQELLDAEIQKLTNEKARAEERLARANNAYDIENAQNIINTVNSKLPTLLRLQESKLIKPYPNDAGAELVPALNKQLLDLQSQIQDLAMQGARRENPEFVMQISRLEAEQRKVLDQLLDLNRASEFDILAKDIKIPDLTNRDEVAQYISGERSYVDMKNLRTFAPTPLNKQGDYVDAIIKAVIKDAENRGINRITIMPADIGANLRWSKESEGAKKKFRNLYDGVGIQTLKNIAKKYGGTVEQEFILDTTKGELGLRFLNKNVDGEFQVLKETDIDPSVTIRREDLGPSKPPEGLNAFLNEEILRVAKDYGPNEVVFRKEIAPGQTMEYFVNVKQGDVVDQKFDLVPLGSADRAENAKIIIEEYNPQRVKMNVLVLPESNKDKPMYLFKKKKGGIMPDDRLVSITDIYGDY